MVPEEQNRPIRAYRPKKHSSRHPYLLFGRADQSGDVPGPVSAAVIPDPSVSRTHPGTLARHKGGRGPSPTPISLIPAKVIR